MCFKGGSMKYWRINTDKKARKDVKTCDLWYGKNSQHLDKQDNNLAI